MGPRCRLACSSSLSPSGVSCWASCWLVERWMSVPSQALSSRASCVTSTEVVVESRVAPSWRERRRHRPGTVRLVAARLGRGWRWREAAASRRGRRGWRRGWLRLWDGSGAGVVGRFEPGWKGSSRARRRCLGGCGAGRGTGPQPPFVDLHPRRPARWWDRDAIVLQGAL